MSRKLEIQLNELFNIYHDVRKAEIAQDAVLLKKKLAEGLIESCLFLENLSSDLLVKKEPKELAEMTLDYKAIKKIRIPQVLDNFLAVEQKILEMVELNPELIKELLDAIRLLVTSDTPPEGNWQQKLQVLTDTICKEAKQVALNSHHRPMLKRVMVAGGGVVIAASNLYLPSTLPFYQTFVAPSVSIGTWLIVEAAEDLLKDFFAR